MNQDFNYMGREEKEENYKKITAIPTSAPSEHEAETEKKAILTLTPTDAPSITIKQKVIPPFITNNKNLNHKSIIGGKGRVSMENNNNQEPVLILSPQPHWTTYI